MEGRQLAIPDGARESGKGLRAVAAALIAAGAITVGSLATFLAPQPWFPEVVRSAAVIMLAAFLLTPVVPIWRPTRLTLPAVWFFSFVALIVVGAHFVLYEGATPDSGRRFLFAIRLAIVLTAFGAWLACRMTGVNPAAVERHYREKTAVDGLGRFFPLLFLALAVSALLLAANYLREVPSIPLLSFLLGSASSTDMLIFQREQSFKLLDSPFLYAYALLRVLGFPFLIAVSMGMYRRTRRRGWLRAFVVLLGAGIFFAGASLASFPVAGLFVILFTYIYLDNAGRISPRLLVAGAILFLAFPVFVVLGLFGAIGVSPLSALALVAARISYDPALTVYYYFDIVPTYIDHLGGRSIGDLSMLLGWTQFDIENYIGIHSEGSRFASVHANGAYIANLHADWGIVGVGLGSLVVGLLLGFGQALILRLPRSPVTIAMAAHLFFCTVLLNMTSLPTVLGTHGALAVIALVVAIRHSDLLLEGICQKRTAQPH